MEIKEEHLLRLLNQSDKGKKPLKWYDKVIFVFCLYQLLYTEYASSEEENK